jgi:hypothetical protein
MKRAADTSAHTQTHTFEEPDIALARERAHEDEARDRERALIDKAVSTTEQFAKRHAGVRAAIATLRDGLRRQRRELDRQRRTDRGATDSALGDEELTLETTEEMLGNERRDTARSLWLMLSELEVIVSAINTVRISAYEDPRGSAILGSANEVHVAAERLLDLVSDLMDPEDNRNLYHDVGGSQ